MGVSEPRTLDLNSDDYPTWRGAKCRLDSHRTERHLAYVTADRTTTSCIDIGGYECIAFAPIRLR